MRKARKARIKAQMAGIILDLSITTLVAIVFLLLGAYLQWSDSAFFEVVEYGGIR